MVGFLFSCIVILVLCGMFGGKQTEPKSKVEQDRDNEAHRVRMEGFRLARENRSNIKPRVPDTFPDDWAKH